MRRINLVDCYQARLNAILRYALVRRGINDEMICFGKGSIDWNAVSAIGTLLASAIALLASWLALKAPEWSKKRDRRESTGEILAASDEALNLYCEAQVLATGDNKWPTKAVSVLRIKSAHLHETLNRLVSRLSLTDGAIAVGAGAGAMSILAMLQSLQTADEIRRERTARLVSIKERPFGAMMVDASTPVKETIEAAQELVEVVRKRIIDVKKHAKIS